MEEIRDKKSGGKDEKKNKLMLIILSLVILVLLFGSLFYYRKSLEPVNLKNITEVSVDIPRGSNVYGIADILKENGLIKSKFVFECLTIRENKEEKLKAGSYTLNTGMSLREILKELSEGGKGDNVVTFTIPEGYELRQIADKLSKEGLANRDRFLKLSSYAGNFKRRFSFLNEINQNQSLEGYLFPATYEIFVNSTEKQIIEKMLEKFEEVYESDIKDQLKGRNLNDLIILASIVEREGKLDSERSLIAGVFKNRLDKGMKLESCATVQYALGERKEVLSYDDLKIDSVYNTYIHKGLPPTPIASPGLKSIRAVLEPEKTDYLFFRTKNDGSGGHIFSRTYAEHLNSNPKK